MSSNRKQSRKRNREVLESLADCRDDSDDEVKTGKTILFQNGDASFTLDSESNYYTNGKTDYDENLIGADYYWHQIIIPHQKKFDAKKVLHEIYKIVGDDLFAPIAYCSSRDSDYFFVHCQGAALTKLFDNDLRVDIDDGQQVNLVVKFCVSKFVKGMLTLPDKLTKIISSSIDKTNPSVMNLSHISSHPQLSDVKFAMSNQGCFELVVENLSRSAVMLRNVKCLRLCSNGIASLKPLSMLDGLSLTSLDLQYNKLSSFDEFNHLQHLQLHEIILVGNSITDVPLFKERIKAILPTLKIVDSMDVEKSPTQATAVDNRSEPIKFFNIDSTKKVLPADVTDYFKKTFSKHDNKLWNKVVVVHKGKVDKNIILIHINRQLFKRTLFVPCYYQSRPKFDTFYLHDNFAALNALVNNNLEMTIPTIRTVVKFELHLQCADWVDGHVDWRKKINYAVKKRLRGSKLNLDEFSGDSDLNDNLIVTMSSIEVLGHVLKVALELNRNIVVMTVKQNKITTAEGFQMLKNFPELKSLDLSSNFIESFETFPTLQSVIEVFVDGNPFCVRFYSSPWSYIEELMRFFPNLEYIDGRRIEKSFIPIVPLQNFLVSRSAYSLAETFIKRFFELYDSRSRKTLQKFYDKSSMFSTSTRYAPELNRISNVNSRNLLHNTKANENRIFIGSRNIVDFLESLPESHHDFPTMCIDVPVMNEQNVLINVNGFFKEQGDSLNDNEILFKFTRTFFLERSNRVSGTLRNTFRFIIKNELLQVQHIGADEQIKAFKKIVIPENDIRSLCSGLTPSMSQAREANLFLLRELTSLKTILCNRLLQDADWDIEVAIHHFLALIERNFFSEENFNFRNVPSS